MAATDDYIRVKSFDDKSVFWLEGKNRDFTAGRLYDFFEPLLTACPPITKLLLCNLQISSQTALALADYLPRLPALTELYLGECPLGSCASAFLMSAIERCQFLAVITLTNCGLLASDCEAIGRMLTRAPVLQALDLAGNKIGTAGLITLAPLVSQCPSLRRLNISGNGISCEGGFCWLVMIITKTPWLTHLDFSNNTGFLIRDNRALNSLLDYNNPE